MQCAACGSTSFSGVFAAATPIDASEVLDRGAEKGCKPKPRTKDYKDFAQMASGVYCHYRPSSFRHDNNK